MRRTRWLHVIQLPLEFAPTDRPILIEQFPLRIATWCQCLFVFPTGGATFVRIQLLIPTNSQAIRPGLKPLLFQSELLLSCCLQCIRNHSDVDKESISLVRGTKHNPRKHKDSNKMFCCKQDLRRTYLVGVSIEVDTKMVFSALETPSPRNKRCQS